MATPDATDPCCKVGAAAERFGLAGLDDWLHERWTAGAERAGVRELAAAVNVRIVRAALDGGERGVLDGEAENYYRLLTDDDVSPGDRTEARARLRDRGVDPGRLDAAFVSHQTVYRHLTGCLDVESPRSGDDGRGVRDELDRVRALQRRTEAVAASAIERLDRDGRIDVAAPDVLVDMVVTCTACGSQFPFAASLDGRSCDCGRTR